MKKTTLLIAVIFIVSSMFSSCDKDELEQRGEVTYKLDGVKKSFNMANSHTTLIKNGEYDINLALGDTKADLIAISIIGYKGSFPATFNMKSSELVVVGYVTNDLQYGATNGASGLGSYGSFTVVIEKFENNKFSGTFEFTGLKLVNLIPNSNEKRVITEGEFTDIPGF